MPDYASKRARKAKKIMAVVVKKSNVPRNRFRQTGIFRISKYAPELTIVNSVGNTPTIYSLAGTVADMMTLGAAANESYGAPYVQYGGSFTFMLKNVADYIDLFNIYQFYRIHSVEIIYEPLAGDTVNGTLMTPDIYTIQEYTDDLVPLTFTEVQDYNNCKIHMLQPARGMVKKTVGVKSASNVYSGQLTYTATNKKAWIATYGTVVPDASASVKHYGQKFWIRNWHTAYGNSLALRIQTRYHLEFKDPR